MAENSKIEWTDHTFNPWRGCAHKALADGAAHPGCEHCYAEAGSNRNPKVLGRWGASDPALPIVDGSPTRILAAQKQWKAVRDWDAAAKAAGRIDRVFCASWADVFDDWPGEIRDSQGHILHRCRAGHVVALDAVHAHGAECQAGCNRAAHPLTLDDVRRDLFAMIDATPHLFWLLLTKRPESVRRMWPLLQVPHPSGDAHAYSGRMFRPNVAIGTSISDQATADELVPKLLTFRDLAPVLFLSVEPLIGPVDFANYLPCPACSFGNCYEHPIGNQGPSRASLDWIIVGGESGHHARPMHPQWVRDIRDQCVAAGVPFFFKQWGEYCHWSQTTNEVAARLGSQPDGPIKLGKKSAGRLLDGREWNDLPAAFTATSK